MCNCRRLGTAAIAAVVVCVLISTPGLCAKRSKSVGRYVAWRGRAVSVPSHIISGSAVLKGRRFFVGGPPEYRLADIHLGRPYRDIIVRWGNPTRITVGEAKVETGEGAPPTQPGLPYTPSGGPPRESSMPVLPGLPALPAPGMPAGAPVPAPGGGGSQVLSEEEVTWTYDLPNGITLEFIITDGIITQITVGGVGPWRLSETVSGIQLGDSYKLILWVCGYPESQKYQGRFLRLSYVNKKRVLFTLLNKRLVGVTIAMVPSDLK
jgi:hypothetical protein